MTGQMLTNIMGAMGRGGDNMVGHLSHGDMIIPKEIVLQNPEFLTKFKKAMEDNHQDYRGHIAGSGYENKNPHTGASEFFFSGLRSFFSNPVQKITNAINDPVGQLENTFKTGTIVGGLMGGSSPTAAAAPAIAAPVAAAPAPAPNLGAISQPFSPTRPAAMTAPTDLMGMSVGGQQFGTLDPTQQRSYLATQGSQGGGLSGDAKDYYMNLLQRNLIDDSGQQQNINSALLPVERNYLSSIGLPTGNTQDFFQALQQPKAS